MNPVIVVTESDRYRLQGVIDALQPDADVNLNRIDLAALQGKLDRARIVSDDAAPDDVVTMNSRFRLRHVGTGAEEVYTLVYPASARPFEGHVSVVDPIGVAVLGCRVGDVVSWPMPGGGRRLRIEDLVFQPEREGCLQL